MQILANVNGNALTIKMTNAHMIMSMSNAIVALANAKDNVKDDGKIRQWQKRQWQISANIMAMANSEAMANTITNAAALAKTI